MEVFPNLSAHKSPEYRLIRAHLVKLNSKERGTRTVKATLGSLAVLKAATWSQLGASTANSTPETTQGLGV